ncbi:pyruvate, water dikinase regulatory protein [Thiohalobacter thiocyanaticus]|uniref:Pyruvate, phosphate dikinase/phosphoenolpyruvate synthase regulator n=1 Tax=Thiohalobacter thiocyanaticus TaxID=585455 RepID=A0A426QLZ6_9GAMM|nr:pyruvate, phosphate dikinase/phosphoenolpyruvate synthase regulator [Thiohalobacter thiocyanaticus]RRQ22781.1 pyruvate, phosphate dikinase/phosphoenolpyruvate synthase regulator [Thiohalobacter thiocyanaticus]
MNETSAYPVFLLSDHTGITVDKLARSLLSQFSGLQFEIHSLSFVDSPEAVRAAVERIDASAGVRGEPPLVFATLIDPALREQLRGCRGQVFDIYALLLQPVAEALHTQATPRRGQTHGRTDNGYLDRIGALEFALATDDGVAVKRYQNADVILIGLSRSGKTPTSLYLALQYGLRAANDPLTEEDLDSPRLPERLQAFRHKLVALRIDPERLHRVREQRRPDSRYASQVQCRYEVRQFESLLSGLDIPVLDSSRMSIEELAASVVRIVRSEE